MPEPPRRGKPDENYIHDEETLRGISTGFHLSYSPLLRSLGKRLASLRRGLRPYRGRLNERWIENALVIRNLPEPPARILDVGGSGSPVPLTLAMVGHRVTVVDLRPCPMRHPNLLAHQGDVRDVPLETPFDGAYAISVIEHAGLGRYGEARGPAEPRELLDSMLEAVRTGGRTLVTVPFGRAHVPQAGDRSHRTGRPSGFRIFDRTMLDELTRGLAVEELRTFGLEGGIWSEMPPEKVEEIPPRRYANGVAFLKLRKG